MEYQEKLEVTVRAAMRLRRTIEDWGVQYRMLSVPRSEVDRFDDTLRSLREDHAPSS